jgi:hypothetical protein
MYIMCVFSRWQKQIADKLQSGVIIYNNMNCATLQQGILTKISQME